MKKIYYLSILLFCIANFAQAQFYKKMAVYVGYAALNEPTISLEYAFHKRLAVNLEGAAFIPFKNEMAWRGIFPSAFARLNCYGGGIRGGLSIYGKKRFGIMHRIMLDLSYLSSGLYREEFAISFVTSNNFYREFMQYGIFYEFTIRLFSSQKRHHMFLRAGIAAKTIHTRTVAAHNGSGSYASVVAPYSFDVVPSPILSVGYRFRLHPQKDYFIGE